MMRIILHAFISLLTFTTGVVAWDSHLTLVNHGLDPIKRILRIKSKLRAVAHSSQPSALSGGSFIMEAAPPASSLYYADEVVVYFDTDLTGRVLKAQAMSGERLFHQPAVEATLGMRFPKRRYRGYRAGTRGRVFFKFVNGRPRKIKVEAGRAIEYLCLD
ncbi:MAG TPA: hypothetical protein VIQ24_16290 [Pyrinomonadaceae bacterium]